MPNIRIGFASDFTLKGSNIGIGTTTADVKLQVPGTLKGDLQITGVTTLTEYGGFTPQKQNITKDSSIGFSTTGIGTVGITSFISVNERETGFLSLVGEYNTVSDDIIVDEGKIFEVSTTNITGITTLGTQEVYAPDDSVVSVGTLESVSIQSHFGFPDGGSNDRPDQPTEGMVRFNDDLNTLEFYNGIEWRQFTVTGASGRGVWAGGYHAGVTPTSTAGISYIQISTLGNSVNFGSLTSAGQDAWGCSSSIRGLFGGGFNGNAIEYITIASEGDAIDFGDMAQTGSINYAGALSSSTRGIWAGGGGGSPYGYFNTIQYVTISTLGNTLDFGDLTNAATPNGSGLSSPTRGLFAVSNNPSSSNSSLINAFTISSTGNAVEFGNLTTKNEYTNASGFSNSTRGVWGTRQGGGGGGPLTNIIDYVTISTFGNAVDFGDATTIGAPGGAVSSSTRGVFCIGTNPALSPGLRDQNVLNYVTIASTGDAVDFGDLTRGPNSYSRHTGPVSDSHGGLGGF